MAKQDGIFEIKGTIGNVTFYKSKNGYRLRKKGGVDASRISSDPAFERTRENGREFSEAAKAGKLLRRAVRTVVSKTGSFSVISRLVKVMSDIKKLDTTSARGERKVGIAMLVSGAPARLKGFNFNTEAILETILSATYTVDNKTGEIDIQGFVPMKNVVAPPATTHVTLKGAWVRVDFLAHSYEVFATNAVSVPYDSVASNVLLSPGGAPAGSGTDLFLLQVEFMQEFNGGLYPLNSGAFNATAIVETA